MRLKSRQPRFFPRTIAVLAAVVLCLGIAMAGSAGAAQQSWAPRIDDRTLHLVATDASEQILASVHDGTIEIDYRITGTPGPAKHSSFALADFDRLDLRAGDGDDFVNIVDPGEALDAQHTALTLDGGDGDNTVTLTHKPYTPEMATRLAELTKLAPQVSAIADDVAQATTTAMVDDAMSLIRAAQDGPVATSQDVARSSGKEIFDPAQATIDRNAKSLTAQADTLQGNLDNLVKSDASLNDQVAKAFDPTGTSETPDPTANPPAEPDWVQPAADKLSQTGLALGTDEQTAATQLAAQAKSEGGDIEARVGGLESKLNALGVDTQDLGTKTESVLTADSDAIISKAEALQSMSADLQAMGESLQAEITSATAQARAALAAPATAAAAGSNGCKVTPAYTYTGGAGTDIFFPFAAPNSSWAISGGGGSDILFGGNVADRIDGGPGNDLIFGLGGNDKIHGDDGVDLLFGEFAIDLGSFATGDDCIWGDDGVDLVVGDNFAETTLFTNTAGGNDDLHGGDKTDLVFGDDVTDLFTPAHAGGQDTIAGDDDIDALFGTGGNDTIHGNDKIDFAMGNGGDDTIWSDGGTVINVLGTNIEFGGLFLGNLDKDQVHGGKGIDVIFGNDDDDQLWGDDQVDIMFGGQGADVMKGEPGGQIATIMGVPVRLGNFMFGGTEDDKMWGGGDLDLMFGNAGNDQMHGFTTPIQPFGLDADLMFGNDGNDTMDGDTGCVCPTSLDFMFGNNGDDTMDGGSMPDFMFGNDGADTMTGDNNSILQVLSTDLMFGNDGPDTMDGGNALDVMFGNDGADKMVGDNENILLVSPDLMFGGADNDYVNGGSSPDLIFGEGGDDTLNGDVTGFHPLSTDLIFGGDGNDTASGGDSVDLVLGDDGNDSVNGNDGLDLLFGNADDDTMSGGTFADAMFGNGGDDTMNGDDGPDLMFGNDGCDTMNGGDSLDLMFGNECADQMSGQNGPDIMFGNDNSDTMSGGNDPDLIFGNDANDQIHGDSHLDLIFGGNGDDCLWGDNGVDLIFGNDGNDCIHGGDGSDLEFGGNNDDTMFGDNSSDLMWGDDGNDQMDGGNGADGLWGGNGNDDLWGGPGLDLLVGGSGTDTTHQSGASGLSCTCILEPCPLDYGDAPNSYGTTLGVNGARQRVTGPRLGSQIDSEVDGIPTANADGDDTTALADEDGVTLTGVAAGGTATATVVMSGSPTARLDGWVDFNVNGVFDPAEQVFTSAPLVTGSNTLTFPVPVSAAGTTYARFRVSKAGGLGPTGLGTPGEVEDYKVVIVADFGDAPNSYGTTAGAGGARHTTGGPVLGSKIDTEADGAPTVGATGDDTTGIDDEDGVTLPTLVQGSPATTTVVLSGAPSALLDAWVDFNANGVFDPTEQVFTSTPVTSGTNTLTFAVPLTAAPGGSYARFRVSTTGGLGPTGFGGKGEVEDYRVAIQQAQQTSDTDFGDDPDSYGTLLGSNGPRHPVTTTSPRLGKLIDTETDGAPTPGANGDDLTGIADEEGVALPPALFPSTTATVSVTLSNAPNALLDAWVDFNANGVFDPTDQVFASTPIVFGTNTLTFPVPGSAVIGSTYTRWRVSAAGGLAPTGAGGPGEVEDYGVQISQQGGAPPLDFGDAPDTYGTLLASNGARHSVTASSPCLGTTVDTETDGVPSILADGDDLASTDDEDGVTITGMTVGGIGIGQAVLGCGASTAKIDGWIDFDHSGTFDPSEQVYNGWTVVSGPNIRDFSVPQSALQGKTYARFRVSTAGGLAPTGFGAPGEVEDYLVNVS